MGCCESKYSVNEKAKFILNYSTQKKIDFNPLYNFKTSNISNQTTYRETTFFDKNNMRSEESKITENKHTYTENTVLNLTKPIIKEEENNLEMKTLILKVLEGKSLPIGYKIKIRDSMINDKPSIIKDKFMFGSNPEMNDFLLPVEENVGDIQFEIKFNRRLNHYTIKDIKAGTGSFVKVGRRVELDEEYIFSFCNTHLFVYKIKSDNILNLKFLFGIYKNKLFSFNPKDINEIRIGRSKSAEIIYKDDSVSRYQFLSSFIFENNKWFVYDGTKDKPSTNGLWIFASKKIVLYDGLIIKSGNTTFKSKIK